MPTRPQQHPLADADQEAAGRTIPPRDRESGGRAEGRAGARPVPAPSGGSASARLTPHPDGQEGSVATEYGLLAVVAATIVSVMLEWATGGGITDLLASVMARVSSLVGL